MAKEKQGFIKLNRGFFDNFLWNEARTYSKAEAWLDLIQMARFEASVEIIGGKVIELQSGEMPASRRYLELRWNWGSTKVSNFLKMLSEFNMIKQHIKSGQTTIFLVKFGHYNNSQTTDKPEANQKQTTSKPQANQNKELQEGEEFNKEKNIDIPPIEFSMYRSLLDLGADKILIKDWLKVRRTKKTTDTQTALNGFLNKVEKSGMELNDVLTICIENSWAGFDIKWLNNDIKGTQAKSGVFNFD